MKKLTIAALALVMLTACGSSTKTGTAEVEVDETDKITCTVTVEGDKITSVDLNQTYEGSTKKDLKEDYGMASTSQAIGVITENNGEWYEQIAYLEQYIVDNGLDAVEMDDTGHAAGDLTAGCTITISSFIEAVEAAVEAPE